MLNVYRKQLEPLSYLLFRICLGVIIAGHGFHKILHYEKFMADLVDWEIPWPWISNYLAIAGEFLGGLGIIVGLLTPIASFGVFFTMLVVIFYVHGWHPFMVPEIFTRYALLILMGSFLTMIYGGGKYSLDNWLVRKRQRRL